MGRIEDMVQHAIDIANDDSHGYSWADRWNVDRDCSSLMYDSADAAGYPVGRGVDKTRYTGTMPDDFVMAGFTFHRYGEVMPYRGCIFIRDPWGSGGHTEMYIGNGQNVGAHIAETGGVYGQPGDQTGNEISITPDYGNWDYILCPPADGEESEDDMTLDELLNAEIAVEGGKVRFEEALSWAYTYAKNGPRDLLDREVAVDGGTNVPVRELISWGYTYSKLANEKVDQLERKVAALEKAVKAKR